MKRRILTFAIGSVLLSTASLASAQEGGLGAKGNFVLGAERLFGFTSNTQKLDINGQEVETKYSGFGLGWASAASPLNQPRLGFDYFVTRNVSVGGNLGYASISADQPGDNGDNDSTGFIFAPRAGYMLGIGDVFGFWPRAGLTYYSLQDPDQSQLALTVEGMFLIAPKPGFAFTGGPILDFGLTGSRESADFTDRNFGVVFGVAGVL